MTYPDPRNAGEWAGRPETSPAKARPADIETGCWLWLAALPLMIASFMAADVGGWQQAGPKVSTPLWVVVAVSVFIAAVMGALVVTGVFLMRSGYRLARTLLTGGAVGSVVYVATRLFALDGAAAVVQAVAGIVGAVLVCGGLFLVHRPDANEYLTR